MILHLERPTLREAVVFGYVVAGLLMLDVVVRTIAAGHDDAVIGGGDVVIAITLTVYLLNHSRLGRIARG